MTVARGSSYPITITTKVGLNTSSAIWIPGPSATFTAEAGGIYEVALLGKRENPRLLIMRVNPKTK